MIDNIPYRKFARLKHACNKRQWFSYKIKLKQEKWKFAQRGYKDQVTDAAVNKSSTLKQEHLFNSSQKSNYNRVCFW